MLYILRETWSKSRDKVPHLAIGKRVAVEDHLRTSNVVAVHYFRIALFCYAQRGSSAKETNRVQTKVCLFTCTVLQTLHEPF